MKNLPVLCQGDSVDLSALHLKGSNLKNFILKGAKRDLVKFQSGSCDGLVKVRQRFTPEVVVPADMTVRPIVERRREAGLTDYLLDYDQEKRGQNGPGIARRRSEFIQRHAAQYINGMGVRNLILAIEDRLGKGSAIDPKDTCPGDYVYVTTINAGAGLESQIVFFVGLRQLFE